MFKELLPLIKYPYTAGVIAILWLGSAIMLAIEPALPLPQLLAVNLVASTIVAGFGFRGKKEF